MTDLDIPPAARSLLRKLEDWRTDLQFDTFQTPFGGLSPEPDGNGKRKRISTVETVDGVLLRAMHSDRRAVIVFWLRRPGANWKFDFALRARHPHEYSPRPVNTRQLNAYVIAADADSGLAASNALASKAVAEIGVAA